VTARSSLRAVAIFEAAKGAIVLVAGCGLLRFLHIHAQHAADDLVRHMYLNPASSHPRIFERLLAHVTDLQLWLLAFGALAYALFRFIEGWGLWRERRWAEWLALASGVLYLPLEIYEIAHTGHWAAVVVFLVNLLIVAILVRHRRRQGSKNRSKRDAA
jgi:uncharacterized membrane protein (DUF2068 family)